MVPNLLYQISVDSWHGLRRRCLTSFLYMTVNTQARDWEKAGPEKRQFLSVLVITWLFSDLAFLNWPRANLGFLSPLIPRRAFKASILKYPLLSHGQVMLELCVSRVTASYWAADGAQCSHPGNVRRHTPQYMILVQWHHDHQELFIYTSPRTHM